MKQFDRIKLVHTDGTETEVLVSSYSFNLRGSGHATYKIEGFFYPRPPVDNPHSPIQQISKPACQCGKEKHGFAKHADWCDIKET